MASLLRTTEPHELWTEASLRAWRQREPDEARLGWWGAFDDERLLGYAQGFVRWHTGRRDYGRMAVGVAGEARRRGIGRALYAHALEHLREIGVRRIWSSAIADEGRVFLEHRGFAEISRDRISELDLREVDLGRFPRLERDAFRIETLRALGPSQALYELYLSALNDIPGEVARSFPYDVWISRNLEAPNLEWDGSFVVLDDGRPVAFAFLLVDWEGRAAYNEMTGTLRDYRGRGLAFAAKLETVRWAAGKGLARILTGNDTRNAPMLAINDRLGYRPTIEVVEYVRDL